MAAGPRAAARSDNPALREVIPPLPVGFGFRLNPTTHVEREGRILWGGAGSSLVHLTDAGVRELSLAQGTLPLSASGRRLGRRLVDAGLAYPLPPRPSDDSGVTIVIPVRDRATQLDRCLAALGRRPVLVVDDASRDAERIREVCEAYGARVLRRDVNGGPAAARNMGLAAVSTPFVAFLDSDCEPPPDWLASLVGHFDDLQVCAVAPCVRPLPECAATGRTSVLAHYLDRRCALDLGEQPAAVRPMSHVPYVPTAALLVRRSVLADGFDESLRYGEDVDLVWRLQASGLQVRYDPSVVVQHREPHSWHAMLGRRFRYGTSTGPLARRHPGNLAPVLTAPLPLLIAATLLLRQPLAALIIAAAGSANLAWKLRGLGIPAWRGPVLVATSLLRLGRDVMRTAVTLYAPLLLLLIAVGFHPWAIAALPCLPYLAEWFERRPRLDPLRWTAARIIEDVAYGCGVWAGCIRSRTVAPLLPRIVWHSVRRSSRRPRPGSHP